MERSRTRQQLAGDAAEAVVAERLVAHGWTVLARNLRVGRAELDLVAVDPGPPAALVIVEVRWRRDRGFGLPEETVDWRKRRHLRHGAARLLEQGLADGTALPALPLRFDLVVLEPAGMRHHRYAIESA